jgi:alpha-tubulin suppressor-like RCC1 family protein
MVHSLAALLMPSMRAAFPALAVLLAVAGPTGADFLFTAIGSGDVHTCGVQASGAIVCCGANGYGQASPPAGTFVAVAAGLAHSCGLKADQTLACWGLNADGQAAPSPGAFKASPRACSTPVA